MDWITIGEVERQTGIPDRTIRRYIQQHGLHIQTKKHHRSILVSQDSLDMLMKIRDWHAAGWTSNQVEDALSQSGLPMTVTVDDDGKAVLMTAAEVMKQLQMVMTGMAERQENMQKTIDYLRDEVAATHGEVAKVRKENRELRELVEEGTQDIKKRIKQVDEWITESREKRLQEQASKRRWWQRKL